jgi:CBS domain-containing protein
MAKSVREAMTASVSRVSPSQSLADAAEVMKRKDVGSVRVTRFGGCRCSRRTERSRRPTPLANTPVVFVHGLWLLPRARPAH